MSADPVALELLRDRPESPFAHILSGFLSVHPGALCAVFVDADGECIDYASRIDPYQAQLIGAQLLTVTVDLAERSQRLGAGALVMWIVEASAREFVVRRVTDELSVAVAVEPRSLSARLLRGMMALAEALRREAGLSLPGWDPLGEPFEVAVRPAAGWGYAPSALGVGRGKIQQLEVLGRWTERGSLSAEDVICFRVRCNDQELTLAHDRSLDRWHRR